MLSAENDSDILSGEYNGVSVNQFFISAFRAVNNCPA